MLHAKYNDIGGFDMKRWFFAIALLLVLLIMVCVPALAQAQAEGFTVEAESFFSWEALGTFSGAVALTVFLVQFLKLPLDRVWRIPTRFVVYAVSLIVLLLAQWFIPGRGGLTWESGLQCVINAVLVCLAAMSAYTELIEKVEIMSAYKKIGIATLEETLPIIPNPGDEQPGING